VVAAQRALPYAIQVADRWHLMENASRAFLDADPGGKGAMVINPSLLTFAEAVDALAAASVAAYLEDEIPDGVMTSAADLKISRI
jgi:hypothetical protein